MKFLEAYRGARIYDARRTNDSKADILGFKVKAEGLLPEPKNLKTEFVEEAENKEKALKRVKKKIDRYLDKHEIEEFIFEDHDQ